MEGYGYIDGVIYLQEGKVKGYHKTWSEAVLEKLRWGLPYLEQHKLINCKTAGSVRKLINRYKDLLSCCEASCLLHGNFDFTHIFVDMKGEKIMGFIDFDPQGGDPLLDLSQLFAWFAIGRDDKQKLDHLLEGYDPDGALEHKLYPKILLYRLIDIIGYTRWCHENGLIKEIPSYLRSYLIKRTIKKLEGN
jgi:Ser/Thr protein kinase RdoA (MazF antagonist)